MNFCQIVYLILHETGKLKSIILAYIVIGVVRWIFRLWGGRTQKAFVSFKCTFFVDALPQELVKTHVSKYFIVVFGMIQQTFHIRENKGHVYLTSYISVEQTALRVLDMGFRFNLIYIRKLLKKLIANGINFNQINRDLKLEGLFFSCTGSFQIIPKKYALV